MNGRSAYGARVRRRSLLRGVGSAGAMSLLPQVKSSKSNEIQTPGSAWTSAVRLRFRVPLRDGGATESVSWCDDSRRVAWRANSGHGTVFDVGRNATITELPPPQAAGTAGGLLWLPGTELIVLGGTYLGQEMYAQTALTIVDGRSGSIVRQVDGVIPPRQEQDPTTTYPGPLSALANTAIRLFVDTMSAGVVALPLAGLRGLEVFETDDWRATAEQLDTPLSYTCALRPESPQVAFPRERQNGGGNVVVIDRRTAIVVRELEAHPASTHVVAYSPDGSVLLSAMLASSFGRSFAIGAPVITPDSDRHKVVAFHASNYSTIGAIDVETRACFTLAFHPDGSIFAMGSNSEVVLFDTATLALRGRFSLPIAQVHNVAFSPDGSWLALGGSGPSGPLIFGL